MKQLLIALISLTCVCACGNNSGNNNASTDDYLSRGVSYYSTPTDDAYGYAIKLNRTDKTFILYHNSFGNKEWQEDARGSYSEELSEGIATCRLKSNNKLDINWVLIEISSDRINFIDGWGQHFLGFNCSQIQ